jgi:putative tryptophan/tyrosine transport system substrate-binding protein
MFDRKRRAFIAVLGGAAAPWPLAARAQQGALPVVGFLHTGSAPTRVHLVAAFHQGLAEAGQLVGRHVQIEYRWADDHADRLPALAADLVRRRATVIAAIAEPAVFAAKAATSTIPTVFVVGDDPTRLGLVASLSRPGGNMTGVNLFTIELPAKRLGLLHELVPPASVVAHLVDPNFPLAETMVAEVDAAARILGRQVLVLKAGSESDIDAAFAAMSQARAGGFLCAGPFFNSRRNQIVALAAKLSIPAIYEWRESAAAGGLISYGTSLADGHRLAGVHTGRILKGERPADMPVVQPTKFEMVINLITAKALGLTVPDKLLALADEVIE